MSTQQPNSAGDTHEAKSDLKSWWKAFRNREKQEEDKQSKYRGQRMLGAAKAEFHIPPTIESSISFTAYADFPSL